MDEPPTSYGAICCCLVVGVVALVICVESLGAAYDGERALWGTAIFACCLLLLVSLCMLFERFFGVRVQDYT